MPSKSRCTCMLIFASVSVFVDVSFMYLFPPAEVEFLGRNLQGCSPRSALALPSQGFSGRRGRGDGGGLWGCTFPMDSPPGPSARAGAGQVDPRAPGGAEGTTSGAGRGCPSQDSPGRGRNLVSPAAWAWRCCGLCGPGSQRGQPQPRLPVPTRLEGHFLPATGSLLF